MRIRTKFALFTSLIVIATTAAVASMGYVLQRRLIEQNLSEERTAQSASLVAVSQQALTVDNELPILNYVKLLQERPGILYAYFVDRSGTILVHSDSRFIRHPAPEWRIPAGSFELEAPVLLGRQSAGKAVIGFSEKYHQDRLQTLLESMIQHVAIAAGLVAAAGLLASIVFAYLLTRPLTELSRGSEEIAKGNFKTVVRVESQDELSELAERFNSMARSLAVLDELKDDFISNVSHDLRNPMAAIQMYTEWLLNNEEDSAKLIPKHRAIIVTIMDSAKRLGMFVTNVLDAAKIKAGRMEYHPQPVDVAQAAQGLHALFGIMAAKKKINLISDIPVGLPPVNADPERLEHILANLMSNSLKFTPEGGSIAVGGRASEGRVDVWVADSGRGIPPDDIPRLFQRFSQAEVAAQREQKIKGTGLGLYIVKEAVESMGGSIKIESVLGKGTRFTLTLPQARRSPAPAAAGGGLAAA